MRHFKQSDRPGRLFLPGGPPMLNLHHYIEACGPTVNIGFGGRFKRWELVGRDGRVKQSGAMGNDILNSAIAALADPGGADVRSLTQSHCTVGSDNTAPDPTQSGVISPVDTTTSISVSQEANFVKGDGTAPYWSRTLKIVFGFSQANATLTEVGLHDPNIPQYWNRQLFRDEQGNAVAITKTNEDKLRIFYEHRGYVQVADDVTTINVDDGSASGIDVQCTTMAHNVDEAPGPSYRWPTLLNKFGEVMRFERMYEGLTLPPDIYTEITSSNFTNTDDVGGGSGMIAVDSDSFYAEVIASTGEVNFANGINGVSFGVNNFGGPMWLTMFDVSIMKDDTEQFIYSQNFHVGSVAI